MTTNTLRKHKLLTKAIEATLPALYANDGDGYAAVAHVKFFSPYIGWEWYATEYDPETRRFFGLVKGDHTELGYFSLDELESAVVFGRVPAVERDLDWTPRTLEEINR